ncbi:MAG: hypothetical protein E7527_01630 [Ruminococcaceae bacterium]|nr:hypothetical protein [Oscillospiraceae bacterium]
MKRFFLVLLCVFLLAGLVACGEEETPAGDGDRADRKLGVSAVVTTMMDGVHRTRVKGTVAAVVLDADGKILDCKLDEVTFTATLQEGVHTPVADLSTKEELGDLYRPTEEDLGGEEGSTAPWHEQAEKFCDYVEGKTGAQVGAIAATDGRTEQIPGCDLTVTDFITAVVEAANRAKPFPVGREDDLELALTAYHEPNNNAKKINYALDLAAVTLDEQHRITGCVTDQAEIRLTVEEDAFTTLSGLVKTKRQLGDGYGMKTASPIGKEWYQQADAFDAYAVGKTAQALAGLSLNEGKTDAVSGCTITVKEMLKNLIKAARQD